MRTKNSRKVCLSVCLSVYLSISMNSADADRQIEQMIAFIAQEAKEKAEEISVKTEKEFMADKLSLETQLSATIRAENDKQKKNFLIEKRINKSKRLTEVRFSTMRHRDEKMNELKQLVLRRLSQVSSSQTYPQLLRFLIAQGLMTLLENEVTIQARKEDLAIVKKELPAAITLFTDTMKASSGVTPTVKVSIDEKNFLPPAPQPNNTGASCTGGVLLSARDGQILCRNTLDHRLELAFEALKPTVRGSLFGVREKLVAAPTKGKHHGGGVSLPK